MLNGLAAFIIPHAYVVVIRDRKSSMFPRNLPYGNLQTKRTDKWATSKSTQFLTNPKFSYYFKMP